MVRSRRNSSVIWKLMGFTFAMIALPIGTYFFSVNFVFNGMNQSMVRVSVVLILTVFRECNLRRRFGRLNG